LAKPSGKSNGLEQFFYPYAFLQKTQKEYPKKALPYLCAEAFAYIKAVNKPYLFERVCASYRALGFGSKNEGKRTERQKSPFGYFWGYQK